MVYPLLPENEKISYAIYGLRIVVKFSRAFRRDSELSCFKSDTAPMLESGCGNDVPGLHEEVREALLGLLTNPAIILGDYL